MDTEKKHCTEHPGCQITRVRIPIQRELILPRRSDKLLDDPWALDDVRGDLRLLMFLMATGALAVWLMLMLTKVHDRHRTRAAAGELCYQGVGPCEEARP